MATALWTAVVASTGWAAAALVVVALSVRPFRRRWSRSGRLACHAAVGAVLVVALIALMRGWRLPVVGLGDVLTAPDFAHALFAGWPRGLAIYAAIWSACQFGLLRARCARLEGQLVAAELRRLRAQLNPHFLFNTLTAISELGYTDPEAADRTITQLSGLLRRALDDSHQQEIALRDELDFLRRYLDIQQVLLRGRLRIAFDIAADTLHARVPGMILQPLVENAVTHGIGRGAGDLTLRTRRQDDLLVIEVRDSGQGLGAAPPRGSGEGIGIGNTRARLSYLYGELANLELKCGAGNGLTARLNIPFHEAYAFDEDPRVDRR